MGKKKIIIIGEAKTLYKYMKEELSAAGISDERLSRGTGRLFDEDAKMKMDEVRRIKKHLQGIHDKEFQAIKAIRSICPKEVWANYVAMGIIDLPEQKLLKTAQKTLNSAWGNMRKRKKKKKGSNHES